MKDAESEHKRRKKKKSILNEDEKYEEKDKFSRKPQEIEDKSSHKVNHGTF